MYSIAQLQDLVNKQVAEKEYPAQPSELYEPIRYILGLGGKRMRPVLLLMACDLFEGSVISALPPALGIELFHNSTLMHDDIMDNAPLRRGKETVHSKWNPNVAILSGDVMLVESFRLLTHVPQAVLKKVTDVFTGTALGVCEGQQMDMNFETSEGVTIAEYIEMIRLKTAVLLAGSLKIGALIANAGDEDADNLYRFGESLGVAFQLQDDILDVYGDPDKFGKQVGGDILSNKKTYLLIKAMDIAEGLDEEELQYWLNAEESDPAAKVRSITDIYTRLGVRQLAEEEMNHYAEKALSFLARVTAPDDKKQLFKDFAEKLLVREN
ncbi:polyprenyl synthetase family protein [Arcticibacter sp. MXS-1]|uniref:polyprenyl synthetase family protein n=1 Tax=Arcticibacter sp. MXS-1 TaxID=3341726 RepID=UPI0035A81DDE